MVDGDTFNNLIPIIVSSLFTFGGLLKANIINEVVYFGVNGVIMFQVLKTNVIVELMHKHNPHIVDIHCMAHQCNLVIQTTSTLILVYKD
jgi:hypothetical protein